MEQGALTLITPIAPGREASLDEVLERIGKRVVDNPLVPFGTFEGVHFARWVVLPPAGPDRPHLLAYESNFDGSEEGHIDELVTRVPAGIDAVYEHCVGFPLPQDRTREARRSYLAAHRRPYAAFHVGHPGLSVGTIQSDIELRRRIEAYIDGARASGKLGRRPSEIREGIQRFVRAEAADLDTSPRDRGLPYREATIANAVVLVAVVVAAVFLLRPASYAVVAALLVGLVAAYFVLRREEEADAKTASAAPPVFGLADDDRMRRVRAREDRFVQNPLTHLVTIKPGPFRLAVLKTILWIVELLARRWYFQGQLGDLSTIHFGRWVILDDRRLLFFSNYDGSWESYLGDFIDKEASWLTAVWTNTTSFPPTKRLFTQGAAHEEDFKRWTRDHQLDTPVWFASYPRTSVTNVLDNALLREGLWKTLGERETAEWLRLL